MIRPKVYIFEGGAPDKLFTEPFNGEFDVELVDNFRSPTDSFYSVLEQCKNPYHYMLVCSEHQLIELIKLNKTDIPENIIYLRSNHDNWNYLTKLNVLELSEGFQLEQYSYSEPGKSFPKSLVGRDWIIKKVGNSGGRGLLANTMDEAYLGQWGYREFLNNEHDILKLLDERLDKNANYIIQELVPSDIDDFAVSVLVRHGKLRDYTIIKSKNNKYNPKWYNFTVDHTKETVTYLMPVINDVINKLGITDGFFEIECTDNTYKSSPKVIEINPRYSWTTSMSRYMESDYSPIECYLNDSYVPFCERVAGRKYDMKVAETVVTLDGFSFYGDATNELGYHV